MAVKDERRLRVGVLGAGAIAQAAHFESCTKASNAELAAICDVADDLRERMAVTHGARKSYGDYAEMLADPDIDAVVIATADAFHVPASVQALEAGKHVLCEKPVGVTVEEAETLRATVERTGKVLQVGHMKRFDMGIQAARRFIESEMGEIVALKAWYCDSTHRYAMTDAVQPLIVSSAQARKPTENPKADPRRYYMLAHGCHLIDTARFLAGDILAVTARLSERAGMWCWFVDVEFANETLGHLDLTVAVRMDWHEGFQIYGANGSVVGKTYNPWYYRSSDVDIFCEAEGATRRVLGADGHFYRRQLESFARVVLDGAPMEGADADDGVASVRAMVAVARSCESGRRVALADVSGGRVMKLGIFAKTFAGSDPAGVLGAVRGAGYTATQYNMVSSGLPAMPDAVPDDTVRAISDAARACGVEIAAVSATYNMIHPDVAVRDQGAARLEVLAAACGGVTRLLTLCTGTRDADDQWRAHPDNATPEAWRDLLASMERAAEIAERHGIDLGIEPELGNVVNSAGRARDLIDELGSSRLKVVLDPANLFEVAPLSEQHRLVSSAVELLSDRIVMGHAKDRTAGGDFTTAGEGVLDYPHYLGCLREAGFGGALVAHGLTAAEAPEVAAFLRAAAEGSGLSVEP